MTAGWQVHVARDGVQPVGFVALKADTVDQLFIAPSWQGRGIGKRLLDLAKAKLPGGFSLTTAVLGQAEAFYRREGLVRGETGLHRFGHEIVRYDWRPPNPVS
jgi:GNAT superfamily N-acetyltransferase